MRHADNRYKSNLALRMAGVLFCLVLISTWITGGLLARYVTTDSGEDEARVAAFVFRIQEELATFEIPEEEYAPGADARVYQFTVTNQTKNGLICETDQEYTIRVTADGSLPLVYTLTETDGAGNGQAKKSIDALTASMWPAEISLGGSFDAGVAESTTYELKIEWPEENDRMKPVFAGGVAGVAVEITSVQID